MKVGDRVAYKDEVGGGLIHEIKGTEYYVLESTGFGDWYKENELLPYVEQDRTTPSLAEFLDKDKSRKPSSKPHSKNHTSRLEVDLHLESFMENSRGLDNFQKLTAQMHEAKKALNNARNQKFKYLCLIHGKGSGKLRQELHQWLAHQKVVDFYDIDISGNRSGVTEVQLF